MRALVRCPAAACGATFEVESSRLGRSETCPACRGRLTARPIEIEGQLAEQERQVGGSAGVEQHRLPWVVLVDNVRSLWNVGSIFRTADACGVSRLMLTGITGYPPRDAISKTALGAEESVPWNYLAQADEALSRVLADGFSPVVLEGTDDAISLDAFRWPERPCLVIGNEVAGVGPELLKRCPVRVSIPMLGVKSSLNVAVAFGIAAHSVARSLARRPTEKAG